MRMVRPRNILCARAVSDRNDTLRNHLPRVGPNNVHAQNFPCLLLDEHLHEPLRVHVGLGARVGQERELADLVGHTRGFEVLLRLPDPRDFRVGVHDRGDGVVVDVSVRRGEVLGGCDACARVSCGERVKSGTVNEPSSSALCANIGPKVTSPMHLMPPTFVLN
jgi:hypothetical protein